MVGENKYRKIMNLIFYEIFRVVPLSHTKLHRIDLKVIDYKKLLLVISIVSSFDIALLVSLVSMIHSYILEIVIALFLIIPLILISYHIIGIYYVKKGLIKDV